MILMLMLYRVGMKNSVRKSVKIIVKLRVMIMGFRN